MSKLSLVLLCLLLMLGCGNSPVSQDQLAPIGSNEQLKASLQMIVQHGTGESALQPIVMGIQEMDASSPAKEELEKMKPKLLSATSVDQRKKIAQQMLTLLDNAPGFSAPASK